MDPKASEYFKMFTEEEINKFETTKFTLNLHERGIPTSFYDKFPELDEFFTVVATSRATGEDFDIVAVIEAKKYPFFGL